MTELFHFRQIDSGEVALDSTGDVFSFTPTKPTRIWRVGVISSTAVTFGSGLTVVGDLQPTAGSATGRGAADVFSIAAAAAGDVAQGKGIWKNIGTAANPGSGGFLVLPGQAVVFEVTAAMTAGDGHVFLHIEELPWQINSPATGSNWLVNMTEVTT